MTPVRGHCEFIDQTSNCPGLVIPVTITTGSKLIFCHALIDSGATGNFMDQTFAQKYEIKLSRRSQPILAVLADGTQHQTLSCISESVTLSMGKHEEELVLDLGHFPKHALILGMPWLRLHNPQIDWKSHSLTFLPHFCASCNIDKTCRVLAYLESENIDAESPSHSVNLVVKPTKSIEPSIPASPVSIPEKYADLSDVFSKTKAELLPEQRIYDCPIPLKDENESPPFKPIYNLSQPEMKELHAYIDEQLKKGFIRRSTSSSGAPIFFTSKKDGSLRPCIDYRGLNEMTIKNRHPLPLIDTLLNSLSGAQVFTKIDLRGAYNLVRIRQGDEPKTAFRCHYGHFEYLVMPFGLTNAPAVFQNMMNDIFSDYLDHFVVIYLDDILVYSKTQEDHDIHVRKVLHRLLDRKLYAKLEKCMFDQTQVEFLGFIVGKDGVSMCPDKCKSIEKWPPPTNVVQTQSFLGFANFYRRFIANYSKIAKPLTDLTKKNNKFEWTSSVDFAFQTLKAALLSNPVLAHPDVLKPFTLHTDASDSAIGAVLSQDSHPIAYYSRKLNDAEINYAVHDKELLAIIAAFRHWRHLLAGAQHQITVFCDHKNLTFFSTRRILKQRHARWAELLSEYDFILKYVPGSDNNAADALSRRPDNNLNGGEEHVRKLYQETLLPRKCWLRTVDTELTQSQSVNSTILIEDPALQKQVIQQRHNSPIAGHLGIHKTFELINRDFSWPGLRRQVKDFIKHCVICQQMKIERQKTSGLLQPLPIPEQPWKSVSIDFIVKLPLSNGYDSICVIVDRLSKMAHFVPCNETITASSTAELFLQNVFKLHGLPDDIVSDRGPQFRSHFWTALLDLLGIKANRSTAYHPQSDGQTERVNQTLEQYLRCFINDRQDNWADLLPCAEFSYNNAWNVSTKCSPFFAVYNFHPRVDFLNPIPEPNVPAAVEKHKLFTDNLSLIRKHLTQAQSEAKRYADLKRKHREFNVGDKVWLSRVNIATKDPCRKLSAKVLGPYTVIERIGSLAYRLALPPNVRIYPVFHVSLLKPFYESQEELSHGLLPSHRDPVLNEEEETQVKEILESRIRRGQWEFLVRWEGLTSDDDTWEKRENLLPWESLINQFIRQHPEPTELAKYEGEEIIASRENNGTEYLIKWKGFTEDQSSWLPETELRNTRLLAQYLNRNRVTTRRGRRA